MRRFAVLVLGLLLMLAPGLPAAAAPAPAAGASVTVADDLGRPVAAAEVEIYRLGHGLAAVGTTDRMGTVRVPGPIPVGSLWQLRVWAKGYRTAETGWVDLSRTPYRYVLLEKLLGDLQVTVVDRDGKPVTARVTVAGSGGQVAGEQRVEGRLLQQGLLTGDYRVLVTAAGYVPVTRQVAVTGDRLAGLTVIMEPAGQLLTGEVRDAVTGRPVAGARVGWLRADNSVVSDGNVADGAGRFRLEAAQGTAGSYKVSARADGYRLAVTAPVQVAPGQAVDWLGPSALMLQPLTGQIAGIVLAEDGAPRINVRVVLEAQGYGEVAATTSANDGSFRFEKLPADGTVAYRARVEAMAEVADSGWLTLRPGITERPALKVARVRGTTFGTTTVTGVVTTPAGLPVEGATVDFFLSGNLYRQATTDAAGAFTLQHMAATASRYNQLGDPYTVRISKDGFVTTAEVKVDGEPRWEVFPRDDARLHLQAELHPTTWELQGQVVDGQGRPVAGVEVSMFSGVEQVWAAARTNSSGWYTFREVAAAPVVHAELAVKAQGYLPVAGVTAAVRPGTGRTLPTIRMGAADVTLTGQVVDPEGKAVAGLRVTLRDAAGREAGAAETDPFGQYRLKVAAAALPATVHAGRDGWSQVMAEVGELPASGLVTRDLVLLPLTARASGRVLDTAGRPVADMRVELLEDGRGVVAATRTDENGIYQFGEMALDGPGRFWLRADTVVHTFAGSLRHGTELVPQMRLLPGQEVVTDLLVR